MLTQTLFELAVLPESDLDSIRTEISDALTSEGGWTPEALSKFRRLDSAMREIARIHMFVQCACLDTELSNVGLCRLLVHFSRHAPHVHERLRTRKWHVDSVGRPDRHEPEGRSPQPRSLS